MSNTEPTEAERQASANTLLACGIDAREMPSAVAAAAAIERNAQRETERARALFGPLL